MGKDTKRLGRGLSSLISTTVAAPVETIKPKKPEPTAPESGDPPAAAKHDRPPEHVDAPNPVHSPVDNPAKVTAPSATARAIEFLTREVPGATGTPATPVRQEPGTAARLDETEDTGHPHRSASNLPVADPGEPTAAAIPFHLPIDALVPNARQPRQSFHVESIAALAKSITRSGMLQPLVVRPAPTAGESSESSAKYELIAGERRWRAARAAGLEQVPVIVRDVNDEQALELAIIENIQREDLNAIDRARAYQSYCREFTLEPDEVAARLGEDRTTVVNYLRLLDLPAEVKEMVSRGDLSMGHARSILGLADTDERLDLARLAIANALSVRALEDLVRRRKAQAGSPAPKAAGPAEAPKKSPHVTDVESRLQQSVGTKVTIHEGRRKGQGRITLEYYSLDDFDRIAAMLGFDAS